jgi:hypothetical protein
VSVSQPTDGPRTFRIGVCLVTVGLGWVVTTWPDGTAVHAHPDVGELREQQIATAKALGYDRSHITDARMQAALIVDHEVLHSLVADALGRTSSVALHSQATDTWNDERRRLADEEERICMLIARLLNVGIDGVLAEREE